MPAGGWLYIFILLFPIFLPERTNHHRNQQKGPTAGRDELLVVRVRNERSVSPTRAADEPQLIPTVTTSKAKHTTSSRLPGLHRNTNSGRNRNFHPMPGTVNALFLTADSHRTRRIPDRRLVWLHNGMPPSNG